MSKFVRVETQSNGTQSWVPTSNILCISSPRIRPGIVGHSFAGIDDPRYTLLVRVGDAVERCKAWFADLRGAGLEVDDPADIQYAVIGADLKRRKPGDFKAV